MQTRLNIPCIWKPGLWITLWAGICTSGLGAEATLELEPPQRTMDPVVWEKVIPEVEKIRALQTKREQLPRRAWFREDQKSVDERITKLMDAAVDILGYSDTADLREHISELEVANRAERDEIVSLKEKRLAAPEEALIEDTVNDINAKIEKLERRILDRETSIHASRAEFAGELRKLGLTLQDDQLDFLLGTVIGDTVVDITIAFYNIREITAALEKLTSESLENMEVARRYYGMYVVLLGILDTIYETSISDIDEGYVPEIEDIRDRTRRLMEETRRLMDQAEPSHRSALANNREAQQYTLDAATLYRDYLQDQSRQLQQARERLAKNVEVAVNTYQTVQLSGDLLAVMQAGEGLFEILFDLQVPELQAFENLELKREFDKLTVRLRGEP